MGSDPRGATLQEVLRQLFRSGSDHLVHRSEGGFLVVHKDELISAMERSGSLSLGELLERLEPRRRAEVPETPGRLLLVGQEGLEPVAPETLRRPYRSGPALPEWWGVPLPLVRASDGECNPAARTLIPDMEALVAGVRRAREEGDSLVPLALPGGEERTLFLHPLEGEVYRLEDISEDCSAAEEVAWWAAVGHSLVERLRQNGVAVQRFAAQEDLPPGGEMVPCLWEGDLLGYLHIPCPSPPEPEDRGTPGKAPRRRAAPRK